MRFKSIRVEGASLLTLDRHVDGRGWFARTFCADEFAGHGLPSEFPQCNISSNERARTLRGMHINVAGEWESKIVRCVRGSIFDVIVDLRPDSPTRDQWYGVELSAENGLALFVPEGLAHGFLTLVDHSDVHYHMGASYVPDAARGFRWDDSRFDISWPAEPATISEHDANYADFDPVAFELPN